jgi:hypothetical protein
LRAGGGVNGKFSRLILNKRSIENSFSVDTLLIGTPQPPFFLARFIYQ